MPERSVELQTWVSEQNRIEEAANGSRSIWGVAPFIGITDQLELALPLEVWWDGVPQMPGITQLTNYGVEARYRFVTQVSDAPFVPLVRVTVHRYTALRDTVRPAVEFVGSYENGRVLVSGDVAFGAMLTHDEQQYVALPAAGVSVLTVDELRLGAEVFAQLGIDDSAPTWAAAGPNLSWTHGRFWVSAAYGVGLTGVKNAPRMQWGIAF